MLVYEQIINKKFKFKLYVSSLSEVLSLISKEVIFLLTPKFAGKIDQYIYFVWPLPVHIDTDYLPVSGYADAPSKSA